MNDTRIRQPSRQLVSSWNIKFSGTKPRPTSYYLLGVIPYEGAMAPAAGSILREAKRAEDSYLRKAFRIALGSREKTEGL